MDYCSGRDLTIFVIVLVLVSSVNGQGAKEINQKLDSFIKKFKGTVDTAKAIEKTVLDNADNKDLLQMADVNELRINVAVFKKLLEQFEKLKGDVSGGTVKVPSMTYLHRVLVLYKVFSVRRAEFALFLERNLFIQLAETKKMKAQRRMYNEGAQEILDIISMLGDMEKDKPGSVIPGKETFFTLDKLADNMQSVFVEIVTTAVKSIRILEDIEIVYTNFTNFIGAFSSSPFVHIANLAESASDVTDVLSQSAKVFLVVNQRKVIKKKALIWFKGADGYLELVTRLDLLKDLLLKITKYRDLKNWNDVKPKDFLDDHLKRMNMLVDDKGNIKKMIDAL